MDYGGVDAAAPIVVDYDPVFGQDCGIPIEEKNEQIYQLAQKYPGRLYPIGNVDPRRPQALQLLKKFITEYKFNAFKFFPKTGMYHWDPRNYPFYEMCIDYDHPVAFCSSGGGDGYTFRRFQDPIHLNDMMAEFRDLRVMVFHSGHPFLHWYEEAIQNATHLNCYLGHELWFVSMTGRRRAGRAGAGGPRMFVKEEETIALLAKAVEICGAHKILIGTDSFNGPSTHDKDALWHMGYDNFYNWFKRLPETGAKYGYSFTQEDVDLMIGGNAQRVLGIGPKDPQWELPHKYGWKYRVPPGWRTSV